MIRNVTASAAKTFAPEIGDSEIKLDHPVDISHGDYSTNIALSLAKQLKKNPVELAVLIVAEITKNLPTEISKVEVAGPGFINFYLSNYFISNKIIEALKYPHNFGKNELQKNKLVVIDYTDPNPFKEFHIGHAMSNVIGEFLANSYEWAGATVKRVSYQGDVGRHVAVTIWGLRLLDEAWPTDEADLQTKVGFLGKAYALGSSKSKREKDDKGVLIPLNEDQQKIENEIQEINKKIYDRSDNEVNEIYDKGKEWSLEAFEEIYAELGTKFDHYFFESQTATPALKIVKEHTGIAESGKTFEVSEGATIYRGEKVGLHTAVFISSQGVPIYAAKDLALAELKTERFGIQSDTKKEIDISLIVTAKEQNENFKVVIAAMREVLPKEGEITSHIGHGMMRFAEGQGKVSSRTGNIVSGKMLIEDAKKTVKEVMKDRKIPDEEIEKIVSIIAVGAIKFSVLKQAIGRDIVYDKEQALSIEGDSGPYLQYTHTRALSILKKADEKFGKIDTNSFTNEFEKEQAKTLSRLVVRFPEIVESSLTERAPQHVVTYALQLASQFNSLYAEEMIVGDEIEKSKSLINLTHVVATTIENCLSILGIKVPLKM